jgi:hypothetical protein
MILRQQGERLAGTSGTAGTRTVARLARSHGRTSGTAARSERWYGRSAGTVG